MRLALVTSVFPIRSETFVVQQVRALLEVGVEVVVFCDQLGTDPSPADIGEHGSRLKIVTWPAGRRAVLYSAFRGLFTRRSMTLPVLMRGAMRPIPTGLGRLDALGRASAFVCEGPFSAVLAHFGPCGEAMAATKAHFAMNMRLATIFHGYDVSCGLRGEVGLVYSALKRDGDLFLPVNRFYARRLAEIGFPEARIVVQHMGVDLRAFTGERRGAAEGTVRILSIGRIVEKKGFEYALRAVAKLVAAGDAVEYRVAGDGPLLDDLRRLSETLGVADRVRFLGWQRPSAVSELLRDSDILLAPSVTGADGDMEGIPVALMEAMAAGTLVVSTEHSGIPELVEHGSTGWLAPERDVEALAAAVRAAIEARSRWPGIKAAARNKIEREFNWARLTPALVALLVESSPVQGDRPWLEELADVPK